MSETITTIPLEQLLESPFNPRRTFNDAGLQELAADIKAHGAVLQPLLVRPRLPNPLRDDIVDGYEIVFGHRRYRAAEIAGLEAVPCMVRAMTDEEAKRAQISENLAREDVHPIEEAEGFQALMQDHGVTADQLAEQTGKSRSYVYGRLKLLQACREVRDACLAGRIGSEVALLIARLRNEKLQVKALAGIKGRGYSLEDGGSRSFRSIRGYLIEHFTLELKRAMFDPADIALLPDVGACSTCPKRTGNAPEFSDVASAKGDRSQWHDDWIPHRGADVCTDPDCFDAKKKAHLKRQAAELEAKGKTVIEGAKARAAIDMYGNVKGAFVALKDVREELKKVKGTKPATVTIQDPRTGKTVEAVKTEDLKAAGVKVGEKKASVSGARSAHDWEKERREREERAKAATEANKRLLAAVREHMAGSMAAGAVPGRFELQLAAKVGLDAIYSTDDEPVLEDLYGTRVLELEKRLPTMSDDELTRLLLDCALVSGVERGMWDNDGKPENLLAAAAHYGIDAEAVMRGGEGASTPSPAERAPKKAKGKAPKYHDPVTGETWSGRGLMPKWLKVAVERGKKLSDFDTTARSPEAELAAADEVKDDAGFAGDERDTDTGDMFEEAEA